MGNISDDNDKSDDDECLNENSMSNLTCDIKDDTHGLATYVSNEDTEFKDLLSDNVMKITWFAYLSLTTITLAVL